MPSMRHKKSRSKLVSVNEAKLHEESPLTNKVPFDTLMCYISVLNKSNYYDSDASSDVMTQKIYV